MKRIFSLLASLIIFLTVNAQIPTDGLVAWYPFNGNANDFSGNGNDGVVYGATLTNDRFGNINKAYYFDGENDSIKAYGLNVDTTLAHYNSISMWVNWVPEPFSVLFSWKNTYDLYFFDNKFGINTNESNNIVGITNNAIMSLNWTHVVVSFINGIPNSSNCKLYINGIQQVITGNATRLVKATSEIYFGTTDELNNNYCFKGKIDDVRLYNRELTQAEVTLLYNESSCGNTNTASISGVLKYNKSQVTPITPIAYSTVYLKNQTGAIIDSTITNGYGEYTFCPVNTGSYILSARTEKPWGGVNSTDALQVLKHFVQLAQLEGLNLAAANVDMNPNINSIDALLIQKRFIMEINSFPVGDWVFENPYVTIAGPSVNTVNIKGVCYGDVNGSYTPPLCYPQATISNAGPDQLNIIGTMSILNGNEVISGETGTWTIISGTEGFIYEPYNPTSAFFGIAGETYTLRWAITNICDTTFDDIIVSFYPEMGQPCPELPSFIYDGQTYNTIQIGNQCWMKENLNVGSIITGTPFAANNGIIEKYCFNDDPLLCNLYGGLYQWDEAMQYTTTENAQGICPQGWHIPSHQQWQILVDNLGGYEIAGGKLKEVGFNHWTTPNTGATNISGFTALGAGYRDWQGSYPPSQNVFALFWTSTEYSTTTTWYRKLYYDSTIIHNPDYYKTQGFSVRCIKN